MSQKHIERKNVRLSRRKRVTAAGRPGEVDDTRCSTAARPSREQTGQTSAFSVAKETLFAIGGRAYAHANTAIASNDKQPNERDKMWSRKKASFERNEEREPGERFTVYDLTTLKSQRKLNEPAPCETRRTEAVATEDGKL